MLRRLDLSLPRCGMENEGNILRWVLKKIRPQSADLSFFSFQLKTETDSASEELRVFNMGLSAMSSSLVSTVIIYRHQDCFKAKG